MSQPPDAPTPPARAKLTGRTIAIIGSAVLGLILILVAIGALFGSPVDMADYASGKTGVSYTSASGGYTATFPSKPESQSEDLSARGTKLTLTIASSGDDESGVQVAFVDYPQEFAELSGSQVDLVLEETAKGAASNVAEGKLESTSKTTLLGHRAIAYRITSKEHVIFARAALVGRRLYLLQAVGGEEGADALARLVSTFRLSD